MAETWAVGRNKNRKPYVADREGDREVSVVAVLEWGPHTESRARLIAAAPKMAEALREMVETVQWMSGSNDFAPEGQGHEGWLKARDKLFAAMAVLAEIGGEQISRVAEEGE